MIPFYKTAFATGSFAGANNCATGEKMSPAERLVGCRRTVKAAFGYTPNDIIPMDKTAFSMRKIGDKNQ